MESKTYYHNEIKTWVEQASKDSSTFHVKEQRISHYKTHDDKFVIEKTLDTTLFTGSICECESFINLKKINKLRMK